MAIAANSQLCQELDNFDIGLVQEPYCTGDKVTCFRLNYYIIQHNSRQPWAAAVIVNPCVAIVFHPKFSSTDCVCFEISLTAIRIVVFSIYCSGKASITDTLRMLSDTIKHFHQAQFLIAGGLNAHSPMWGGEAKDDCGKALQGFVVANDLVILNDPNSPPTFSSENGISWIDVIICSGGLLPLLVTGRFESLLQGCNLQLNENSSRAQVEACVNAVIDQICDVCNDTIPRKRNHRWAIPWWNVNLSAMRRENNWLHRKFQRSLCSNHRRSVIYTLTGVSEELQAKNKKSEIGVVAELLLWGRR
ncbi:uncharacterized protein LOC111615781 [Centruroides sculpturatus]|uniref:uncharacterized protein LOC111615781 n=1 Tax=Centruroides sculpturatus TaxID=218467 RepID=UPI000C6D6AE5|nr:uncharacterized protein LOC111615781 [Centruroides sculpturatus]